jgi:hypothetical protein
VGIVPVAEFVGYVASGLVFLTFCMKTMVPLRLAAIGSNVAFIAYAGMAGLYPILILHVFLLPMNIWRTVQMYTLIRRVRVAARGDLSIDWLKPYMRRDRRAAGEVLFRRGDHADRLFYLIAGEVELVEIGVTLAPGSFLGEIALFSPDQSRTQTATCLTAVEMLWITGDEITQLCYQNPAIAFHLLRIITARLLMNAERPARA